MRKGFFMLFVVIMILFTAVFAGAAVAYDIPSECPDEISAAFKSEPVEFLAVLSYEMPRDHAAHFFSYNSHNASCLCGIHSGQVISLNMGIDLDSDNNRAGIMARGSTCPIIGMYRVLKCPLS